MTKVWESSKAEGGALLVMLALADWCNDEGICWPSITKLAEKSRLSERQTQYVLRSLESDGELYVERSTGGRNKRSTYYLTPGQTVQSAQETMQTLQTVQSTAETVQFATQTVQPTAPALTRQLKPLEEPSEDIYALGQLRGFKKSYTDASPKVRESLSAAAKGWDLDIEVVKIADWLDRHRGRQATVAFLLNWFTKEQPNGTQRTNTSLSQFTRGAGGNPAPAGTDSEWWRRVGRYQTNG